MPNPQDDSAKGEAQQVEEAQSESTLKILSADAGAPSPSDDSDKDLRSSSAETGKIDSQSLAGEKTGRLDGSSGPVSDSRPVARKGKPRPSRAVDPEKVEREKRDKSKKRWHTVRRIMLLIILLAIALIVASYCVFRWCIFDDANSIQGTWRVGEQQNTVTITEDKIILTDDVAYDYVIDPASKTITYTFGNLSGSGRYRFSVNRQQISIDDGEYGWFDTLMADVPWTIEAMVKNMSGTGPTSPQIDADSKVMQRVG